METWLHSYCRLTNQRNPARHEYGHNRESENQTNMKSNHCEAEHVYQAHNSFVHVMRANCNDRLSHSRLSSLSYHCVAKYRVSCSSTCCVMKPFFHFSIFVVYQMCVGWSEESQQSNSSRIHAGRPTNETIHTTFYWYPHPEQHASAW